ncbi:MAG TPA: hypothetical protein DIU15_11585 [Deltaproteobacteria bacterium]|nr:hypothetical protein [Deltaproteobacteria bacterium]
MNGHWVDDELADEPILVSNDALLLDDQPCFDGASFDGESRVVASFFCDPLSQGLAEGRILITQGTDGFRRRIIDLQVMGDDVIAETEAVNMEEIYLVAQFRKQVVIEPQPLPVALSGARDLSVEANWTLFDEEIDGEQYRIKLGGNATLRGILDFDFDIRLCAGFIPCADYRAATGLEVDLEMRLVLELARAIAVEADYGLPFTIPISTFALGGLPVVVSIDIDPKLFWEVATESKLTTQVGFQAGMRAVIGVGGTIPGLPENLSGLDFSGSLQDPSFDEVHSARARVGFKFRIEASFNETVHLYGSIDPYLQAKADADCDEVDVVLQHGVETALGFSLGWGSLSIGREWDLGGLGPYDIYGTSVPVEGLLAGDSDCVGDGDPGAPTEDEFLPDPPSHEDSTDEEWFQDHLAAMEEALQEFTEELEDIVDSLDPLLRGVAFTTDGNGYWTIDEDGVVAAFGSAEHHCDMPEELIEAHEPQGLVPMPEGDGYWIYTGAGRVFACSYGEVDNEDDLITQGEEGVVDMAAHPDGGYWLLEADGQVHAFGGAPNHGSAQLEVGSGGAVSLVPEPDGSGYRILTLDRQLLDFGSASPLSSSDLAIMLSSDVAVINDMAALPGGGLVFVNGGGRLFGLNGADETVWEGWVAVDNPVALAVTPSGLGGVVLPRNDSLAPWGDVPQ